MVFKYLLFIFYYFLKHKLEISTLIGTGLEDLILMNKNIFPIKLKNTPYEPSRSKVAVT